MTRALNIKISDDLYNQLHRRAKDTDCTKTEIVETALHRLFNDVTTDVDNNVDSVDNTATSVDIDSSVDDVDDVAINVDEIIQQKLESYLEGVSCQLPINVDSSVDSVDDVDNKPTDVDSSVDSVDDVDNKPTDVDATPKDATPKDATPKTLKVKELATRLMISKKQIYAAAKHDSYIFGTPLEGHPEKWEYIPNSDPKQFKLIERSG